MIVDMTFADSFDESPLPQGIFSGFGWTDFTPFLSLDAGEEPANVSGLFRAL